MSNTSDEWVAYDDVRLSLQMRKGQTYWYAIHEMPGQVPGVKGRGRWVVVQLFEGIANRITEFPTEKQAKAWVDENIR